MGKAWRFSLIIVFIGSAAAQTTANSTGSPTTVVRSGTFAAFLAPGNNPSQPVTGLPYSAEQITEHVQTLADGTHITQAGQKTLLYRDSEGRTRTEHVFTPPPGAAWFEAPNLVQIVDPVAGYRYTLDQRNQQARRMAWQPQSRPSSNTASAPASSTATISAVAEQSRAIQSSNTATVGAASTRPHPEISHESLGSQTIEGILAEGVRMTVTYPEGFMGNDRPITTVSETWTSADLKMVVLSKTSDPRSGESTTRLTNISRNEPDPSLFQVPADYSIVDQPEPNAVRAAPGK